MYVCQSASAGIDKDLIGWLGETYQPASTSSDDSGMTVLSWNPRIFHYRKFLTTAECDHLRSKALHKLSHSGVVDTDTGGSAISRVRTSSDAAFLRGQDHVIARIEARIAAWTMLPVEFGEGLQVLRYQEGQLYEPHHDYFKHSGKDDNGGNRLASVLMYLSDVEAGGETVFPRGLSVKPRKGDAVLFWSMQPDGRLDPKSMHGGCPVVSGEKWCATKWIHIAPYAVAGQPAHRVTRIIYAPPPPPAPPGCKDENSMCPGWAESGQCDTNPGYMVGTAQFPGACLLSCERCDLARKPG
eukprot:jgi/Chrzof1/9501/Cz04g05150.t1